MQRTSRTLFSTAFLLALAASFPAKVALVKAQAQDVKDLANAPALNAELRAFAPIVKRHIGALHGV